MIAAALLLRRLLALCLLLPLLLAGCAGDAIFERMVPKAEEAMARDVFTKLVHGDIDAVLGRAGGPLKAPQMRGMLEQAAGTLPAGEIRQIRTIAYQTGRSQGRTTVSLTQEVEFPDRWLLVGTLFVREADGVTLQGLHLRPFTEAQAVINRFTFEGKGLLHWIVFALAIAIPLLVLYALVQCVRTPNLHRKIRWFVFVALGLFQFQFNWTDGSWVFHPLSFSLFGSGVSRVGSLGPYIFVLSLPLGAISFLVKRRGWQQAASSPAIGPTCGPATGPACR